jgi:signal transduction histidine kinase
MDAYQFSTKLKFVLIVLALMIAVASLWYTNQLANQLQARERDVVVQAFKAKELLAQSAYNSYNFERFKQFVTRNASMPISTRDSLLQALDWAEQMPPSEYTQFIFELTEDNTTNVPQILTDTQGNLVDAQNVTIDSTNQNPEAFKAFLRNKMNAFSLQNKPIQGAGQTVYFGESAIIDQLRLFPYVQLLFVTLFVMVGYFGLAYLRRSEQSNLWVGMAKEAAHQLGTPTSSLMGWVELMKVGGVTDDMQEEVVEELEKDIARLERVAHRFSKIGSQPQLQDQPLAPVVNSVADYMRNRLPNFSAHPISITTSVAADINVPLATDLFEWVLENLIKNAMDAMDEQQGSIHISASILENHVILDVKDSGKGMDKKVQKSIFKPGFSTKKRGWGLGLSLAKRIVEEYHKGRIYIFSSKIGEGTTFRIELPVSKA